MLYYLNITTKLQLYFLKSKCIQFMTFSVNPQDNSKRDVIQEPHDLNDSQDSDSQQEKGQKETSGKVPKEKDNAHPAGKTERSPFHANYDDGPSDDSEPEPEGDNYVITEDQQRAMMELMAIKKESGDYQGTLGPVFYDHCVLRPPVSRDYTGFHLWISISDL